MSKKFYQLPSGNFVDPRAIIGIEIYYCSVNVVIGGTGILAVSCKDEQEAEAARKSLVEAIDAELDRRHNMWMEQFPPRGLVAPAQLDN
jgi:hypothetical protein